MRLIRRYAAGLALLALPALPAAGHAQSDRSFDNSWFWGINGGSMLYWTAQNSHALAPSIGLDWLITRRHFALLVGIDQTFFTGHNLPFTNVGRYYTDTTYVAFRDIAYGAAATVHNSRHLQAAFLAVPWSGPIRPYGGLGLSVNFVEGTVMSSSPPPYGTNAALWFPTYYSDTYRNDAAEWVTPMIIAGVQGQLAGRVSLFGQVKLLPTSAPEGDPRLFTNQAFFMFQAGVRINATSAIGNF
jgi:hypothetical protein